MDQCHCKRCGKTVTHKENHACFIYKKFDYRYLQSRPVEAEKHHDEVKDKSTENSNDSSNEKEKNLSSKYNRCTIFSENFINEQLRNSCDSSYYDPISDVQMIQTNVNASSENIVSSYRPENHQLEAYEELIVVTGASAIDMQKQSGVSDFMHATTDIEYKMSLEKRKWQTLNKDKNSFMDSLECVIRNFLPDNKNNSGTANVILETDLLPESKKQRNGKKVVSENINEHISLEVHSHLYYKNEKRAANAKEAICNKENDNAVAGPSGFNSRKKKTDKTSSEKDTLKTNYRTHTDDRHFICVICNKQFSKKSNRDHHYRTHTGETPYVCDVCGRKFSHIGNHNRHYRTHTGGRPFVCDFCEKGFAQKAHLKKHVRTHTGEKPFVCEVCNKAFAEKGNLKAHARTHTGEKPYKCPICGKAFTTSSCCIRHQRSAHK
ncbi:zinc finger protein 112-like [Argiope bruennichi]|uniref:zinc finger protein 112-like n=1 Tax=Argiope bruennichi TaxID=94029 RepID=UPI0024951EA9|nr:zinc finger protein 112-like [Argiope bruennichi]